MPAENKVCRVCGKAYEACRSIKRTDNVFNWREVACSVECGFEYLSRVEAARNGGVAEEVKPVEITTEDVVDEMVEDAIEEIVEAEEPKKLRNMWKLKARKDEDCE